MRVLVGSTSNHQVPAIILKIRAHTTRRQSESFGAAHNTIQESFEGWQKKALLSSEAADYAEVEHNDKGSPIYPNATAPCSILQNHAQLKETKHEAPTL